MIDRNTQDRFAQLWLPVLGMAWLLAPAAACRQAPEAPAVEVYLVALDSAGSTGPGFGCGDVLVPVTRPAPPAASRLEAALRALVQAPDTSGLVNRVAGLAVERVTQEAGHAAVYLSGRLTLGGVCDHPRIEAQLRRTAQAAAEVDSVAFYVEGEPLADVLSLRGR